MLYLQNGCARSQIKVTPSNWSTQKGSVKKKWKVYYRFYDPAFKDTDKWGYMDQYRGMNDIPDLKRRQDATRVLIEAIKEKVDLQGYNPITQKYFVASETVEEILPEASFFTALFGAHKLLNVDPIMHNDIHSVITEMQNIAGKLYDKAVQKPYPAVRIKDITSRHLVYLMAQCRKDKELSGHRYNRYRSYLIMLFKEIKRVQAILSNPALDIEKDHTWVSKKRELITDAEAVIIDINLKSWDYNFWRFMRIFYRSGSRETEMLKLQKEKVDLDLQEFRVLVKKGRKYIEHTRAIPDDVLPLWKEAMREAAPGQYLFSRLFKPGDRSIGTQVICDRWKKHVKDRLGIQKDFYSLKHKNLDKIEELHGLQEAQDAAGHTTGSTTQIYTVGKEKRDREKLKRISIDF